MSSRRTVVEVPRDFRLRATVVCSTLPVQWYSLRFEIANAFFVRSDIALFLILNNSIKLLLQKIDTLTPWRFLAPRKRCCRAHKPKIESRIAHRLQEREKGAVFVMRRR